MYNLRYHIASLVAVFLSLSIGLLLGTIVVERGTLDRQKETIVSSLQEEFRTLDAANSELRDRAASREDLVEDMLPIVIDGQLTDQHILVIAGTGRVDGLSTVTEAIRSAGGVPITMILSAERFGLDDPAISAVVTDTVDPPIDSGEFYDAVVAVLGAEWASPVAERSLTARLDDAGVLRIDGDADPARPIGGIVTLAALGEGPESGALSLAAVLADAGIPALGVEATSQSTGVAAAAVEEGLSGVDHIGTPEGTYSLVYVLSGRASGHFGYEDGAIAPWPSLQ